MQDAILANRRPDIGLTWNERDTPTSEDNSQLSNSRASTIAWLQLTPALQPPSFAGVRSISNKQTGLVIDSFGDYGWGQNASQWQVSSSLSRR